MKWKHTRMDLVEAYRNNANYNTQHTNTQREQRTTDEKLQWKSNSCKQQNKKKQRNNKKKKKSEWIVFHSWWEQI